MSETENINKSLFTLSQSEAMGRGSTAASSKESENNNNSLSSPEEIIIIDIYIDNRMIPQNSANSEIFPHNSKITEISW